MILACALVAACGSKSGAWGGFRDAARSYLGGSQGESAAPLTRSQIAAMNRPVLQAAVPSRSSGALLVKAGQNGDAVTWLSPDGIGLTLRRGMLVATRGFGPDLITSDISATLAALRSGGSNLPRVHEYLTGSDRIQYLEFTCDLRDMGKQTAEVVEKQYVVDFIEEDCSGHGLRFTNQYFLDSSGRILKSRQWIGPQLGYVLTQLLAE